MTDFDIYYKTNTNLNIDTYLKITPSIKTLNYINSIYNRYCCGIIYCITSESYKKNGKYKIGMTRDLSSNNLKKRYKTYFGGETPEIIMIKNVGDVINAEKLAHFIFKQYRLNNTEWFCFGNNYDNIFEIIEYQFSYISYHYPTLIKYLEYINIKTDHIKYIKIISDIY